MHEVAAFLDKMRDCTNPGGRIAVMGPNFRYCPREYFDFADHRVILTEKSTAEQLYDGGAIDVIDGGHVTVPTFGIYDTKGDWIIEGENREHYVVDDAFFQRTFAPIPWEASEEGRHYGC